MKPTRSSGIAATLGMAMILTSAANGATFTSTFDDASQTSAEGWYGVGNTGGSHNVGFSATDTTGGLSPGGEAGGLFARTSTVMYYGRSLGGTYSLGDSFHADGEFSISTAGTLDNSILIGFFNSGSANGATTRKNWMGMTLQEPGANGFRARSSYFLSNGTVIQGTTAQVIHLGLGVTTGTFSFDYNPTGGTGFGALTLSLTDSSGVRIGTLTRNLNSAQRPLGAEFDSFGMVTGGIGAEADPAINYANIFIDNLNVSAVPEPGTAALLGVGAVCLWLCRRKSE